MSDLACWCGELIWLATFLAKEDILQILVADAGNPSTGWARVRDFLTDNLASLIPTSIFLAMMAWLLVRVIRDIRDRGRLGWKQAAILLGYFVIFVTLLTVESVNWTAIGVWAAIGALLLEVPKAFLIHDDYDRARLASFALVGFSSMMLALQLARGQYLPDWWQFPGVLLGAVVSFVFLEDLSLYSCMYKVLFRNPPGEKYRAGQVLALRRNQSSSTAA